MVNPLEQLNLQPKTVPQQTNKDQFEDFSAELNQVTTRGDGKLEKGDSFNKEEIDFESALEHLKIHHEGNVAGSQFNSQLIKNPQNIESLLKKILPEQLNYDQHGRAEITLDVSRNNEESIGWTGVKDVKEIQKLFPGAKIEQKVRMPGGKESEVDEIKGAWYPEMARNSKTGQLETVKDEDGNIKNTKGKFEPVANIAIVNEEEFKNVAQTNLLTVIIQKDNETQKPTVLTIFPGGNAPMYPAKINSEDFKLDTLKDGPSADYWKDHTFIQVEKK